MNTDTPSLHPGYLSDRRRLSPAPDSNPKYVVCCNCNAATPWTFPFPRYCTRCSHRVQKCYRSFQLAVGIRCGWHGSCCVSSRVCWVAINDGMSCNRGYRWCWSSEDAIENHYDIHWKGSQLSTRSCLSISWFFFFFILYVPYSMHTHAVLPLLQYLARKWWAVIDYDPSLYTACANRFVHELAEYLRRSHI